jgi:hypothetical protein
MFETRKFSWFSYIAVIVLSQWQFWTRVYLRVKSVKKACHLQRSHFQHWTRTKIGRTCSFFILSKCHIKRFTFGTLYIWKYLGIGLKPFSVSSFREPLGACSSKHHHLEGWMWKPSALIPLRMVLAFRFVFYIRKSLSSIMNSGGEDTKANFCNMFCTWK